MFGLLSRRSPKQITNDRNFLKPRNTGIRLIVGRSLESSHDDRLAVGNGDDAADFFDLPSRRKGIGAGAGEGAKLDFELKLQIVVLVDVRCNKDGRTGFLRTANARCRNRIGCVDTREGDADFAFELTFFVVVDEYFRSRQNLGARMRYEGSQTPYRPHPD